MIYVRKASLLHEDGKIKICCDIDVNAETQSLYFLVDSLYEKYITVDRADAFLVMLLYFAMRDGHDISFESPLSEQLLYQVQVYLIDALHKANPSFRRITISCPYTLRENFFGTEAGTGMSCGVDSMATLLAHQSTSVSDGYRATHLTYFDVGAFQYDDGMPAVGPGGADLFLEQLQTVKNCADDAKLPILIVRSNLGKCFPSKHILVHTYRNCGTVLLFQKLFNVYYYSSGSTLDHFICSPDVSTAEYDLYSLPLLSTESTRFYSYSPSCNRLEKTSMIMNYPLAHYHLLVCTKESRNCGMCRKCSRTMITLDALNALQNFSAVFNLDQYKKTRTYQIGYLIASLRDPYNKEVFPLLKKSKKIPAFSWVYAIGFWLVKPLEKWLNSLSPSQKRKAVRFAKKMKIHIPW